MPIPSHINNIVCRAKQRAALIHRCFFSRDIGNLVRAFKVYVRPLVECSPQIWSPSNVGLINLIESIQRSFTKRLPGFQNLSYSDRLTKLKLQSLEHRRLIFDLIYLFIYLLHFYCAVSNMYKISFDGAHT